MIADWGNLETRAPVRSALIAIGLLWLTLFALWWV
jgi:hypothetical protein